MTKKKNENDAPKKGAKHSGKRFGNRREDYVDSFRWGFVQGNEDDHFDADGEEYFDRSEIEILDEDSEKEHTVPITTDPTKPSKGPKKAAHKVSTGRPSTPKSDSEEPSERKTVGRPARTERMEAEEKKGAKKPIAPHALFEDDEEDLNLPSYGRTPVPTDDELPPWVPRKSEQSRTDRKSPKQAATTTKKSETTEKTKTNQPVHREEEKKSSPARYGGAKSTISSEHARKEQMVWDPERREYVPLTVPESYPVPVPSSDAKPAKVKRPSWTTIKSEAQECLDRLEERESQREKRPERVKEQRPRNVSTTQRDEKPELLDRSRERESRREKGPERSKEQRPKSASTTTPLSPFQTPHSTSREQRPRSVSTTQRGAVSPMKETKVPDPADIESETRGFAELGLSETMLEALKIVRYLEPTLIQSGVFLLVRNGRDLMGQAQTGTGKTAAFSIPIIEGIEDCPPGRDPVALILVPTRELAVQVRDEALRLSYGRDLRITACYGGKPLAKQIARLRDGVDILVGTPGRLLDLMNRQALSLDAVRWVVLDEADRMLDIGFRPDIEKILRRTPKERQTLLFSATLPPPVVRLAEKYMNKPEVLDFSSKGVAVDTIEQFYITVDTERKFDALVHLLNREQPTQAIIFTRTKRGADRLARLLGKRMDNLAAIHGDLAQGERDRVMSLFRAGKLRYLVATDVVGRGIDVSGISHIINYDIPAFCDDYIHRVGRTGRMGREGVAYTFVTVQEGSELTRIEMRIDKLLKRADLKGFESFAKPVDEQGASDEPQPEAKPVFGKPVRKNRRAL